jgi:2-(1,2-epoxy-1,2-dihydrophenyl)acetyl-CoA isomerase
MSADSHSPVAYDVTDGVATITLTRPQAMNSLVTDAKVALRDAVHTAAADPQARAVVLTGSGRAFCVGQDLKEHVEKLRGPQPELWRTVPEHFAPIATALASMPKPVIAAVNGVAAGAGLSFALACDLRIVGESAGFNTAFAAIGLSCDSGASWTLPRIVGHAQATQLLMLPRTIKAREALELGIATEVVPDDQLAERVRTLAIALAAGPTLAYAAIKRVLAFSATHDLAESMEHEATKMALTGATEDHAEAVQAFLDKRPPRFLGR